MKFKKFLSVILTLCMVGMSFASMAQVSAQTENGQNQFVINSEEDFSKLMTSPEYWESDYKITLALDIDMKDKEFKPIETFNGKFDGCGHTIKNLTIKDKSSKYGSFYLSLIKTLGSSTESAEFKNITFDNYTIKDDSYKILKYNPDLLFTTSDYYASGLVNDSYGTISGVNIKNGNMININKPEYPGYVSGFVYSNEKEGIIENCSIDMKSEKSNINAGFVCSNFGKITNSSTTLPAREGGFVNTNYDTIEGCSSTGDVTGKEYAGGFVIKNCHKGIINNCKATGNVKTNHKYGSASGFALINSYGTIKNSTACGDVKGKSELSGFIRSNYAGTIINCEATGNVTGSANSDASGFVGKNETYRGEYGKQKKACIERCKATGSVKGEKSAAGFVGCNSGEIADCTASGSVTGKKLAGGFVGQHGYVIYDKFNENYNKYYSGSIKGCKATGDVQGKECAGGFAGTNKCYSEIIECSAEGNTIGEECVGGFVGMNEWNGDIIKCTATGNATANTLRKTMKCGGFAGTNSGRGIEGCTAKGKATAISKKAGTAKAYAGGFVGENTGGKIDGCEATGGAEAKSSLGEAIAGGFVGVAEKCNITNSKSSGAVYLSSGAFSKDDGCGGFVGKNNAKGVIENCSAKCEIETTRGNKGGGFVGEAEDGSTIKNCTCESVRVKKGKTISSLNELIEKSFYYKKSDKAEIL